MQCQNKKKCPSLPNFLEHLQKCLSEALCKSYKKLYAVVDISSSISPVIVAFSKGKMLSKLEFGRISGKKIPGFPAISGKACRIIRLDIRQEKSEPAQPYRSKPYDYYYICTNTWILPRLESADLR